MSIVCTDLALRVVYYCVYGSSAVCEHWVVGRAKACRTCTGKDTLALSQESKHYVTKVH